jgi:hypothetical protein
MNTAKPAFNPWPYGIVATFVIFIASTAALIAFICQHSMDLVSPDYYEQEIRYQGRLDELNRSAALGARITFDAATRELRVQLPSTHAASQPQGRLHLYRPSAAGLDRELKLAPDARGRQTIPAPDLAAGAWKARLHWTVSGQGFFVQEALLIPPPADSSRP